MASGQLINNPNEQMSPTFQQMAPTNILDNSIQKSRKIKGTLQSTPQQNFLSLLDSVD